MQGAKHQSWYDKTPRNALRDLVAKHPRATEAEISMMMNNILKHDDEMQRIVNEYWFQNNWLALRREKGKKRSKADKAARVALVKQQMRSRLMELVMPNGKALGDCTHNDLVTSATWQRKLARKLKPNQTVRHVYTEDQLQEVYAASMKD